VVVVAHILAVAVVPVGLDRAVKPHLHFLLLLALAVREHWAMHCKVGMALILFCLLLPQQVAAAAVVIHLDHRLLYGMGGMAAPVAGVDNLT
jgi:hypothetical protein